MKLPKFTKYFYTEGKAKLTYFLIGLSCFVFFVEVFISLIYGTGFLEEFVNDFGCSLNNVLNQRLWVFITSIFLHASPEHLLLNMLALFFFGRIVEIEMGWKKYLLIFFVASLLGDLGILLTTLLGYSSATVSTIGISGAVFGLMGTAMLVKPFDFVFYPYLIPVPVILVALLYTLYNVAAFVLVLAGGLTTNISYISHIGGLAGGMFFGFKQEGQKKGLMVLLVLLFLLVAVPLFYFIFQYLELANYAAAISQIFK